MTTQSTPFESINLEPSVRQVLPPNASDTSDDGLDPNDFLSQSQTDAQGEKAPSDLETSLESPTTPHGVLSEGATPTLSNSLNLSVSRDSLSFSFGNLREFSVSNHARSVPHPVSPVEHLLERHETLSRDMQMAISLHREYLASGDDCSSARTAIGRLFSAFSETAMSLQEVYSKEANRVDQTLASFRSWDKKRAKVLSRIQKIKSENNEYGAKLGVLLGKRSSIDKEIDTLQQRLDALRGSRSALDKEVDETMSVLESKSAKYVNMFRNLEKIGTDAVRDYLGSDSEENGAPLLRYESVSTEFVADTGGKNGMGLDTMRSATGKEATEKAKEATEVKGVMGATKSAKEVTKSTEATNSPASMGAQAFEVPESDHFSTTDTSAKTTSAFENGKTTSAYQKGYAKGSEQVSTVKKRLSLLLSNGAPPQNTVKQSTAYHLGDSSNTITRKLDLSPIVELLSSKSEALDDLVMKAAKTAEAFHEQGLVWDEICKFLDSQENLLSQSINTNAGVVEAQKVLEQTYNYLKDKMEENSELFFRPDESYVNTLAGQELFTVATALDQITGKNYVSSVLSSGILQPAEPRRRDLRYSITSISSQVAPEKPVTTVVPKRKSKFSAKIEKDIKNE